MCRHCGQRTRCEWQIAGDLRRLVRDQRHIFRELIVDQTFPTEEARSTAIDALALGNAESRLLRIAYELRGLCPQCACILESRALNRRLALNELPVSPC
ncbi:hypothetical protein DAT35_54845 [Vitiosangium sp. GDMCC 1.1324]|nr:hypothetical protein DAT35_54845 [Vitiosangium sp. GDMCC 1.1324]